MTTLPANDRYEEGVPVSLLAHDQYVRELAWMEELTEEEELQCLQRVRRGRLERAQPVPNQWVLNLAKHARDRLIEGYQPMVLRLAQRVARRLHSSIEILDLVNEGTLGLMRVLDEIDILNDGAFRALAIQYIRGAMFRALADRWGLIHVSRDAQGAIKAMRQAARRLEDCLGRPASYGEIAAAMQVSVERVCELVDYYRKHGPLSLQGLVQEDDHEDAYTFTSVFEQAATPGDEGTQQLHSMVRQSVEQLGKRQRDVICLRYGLDDHTSECRPFAEVGTVLGISAHAASSSERKGRKRLVNLLASVVA